MAPSSKRDWKNSEPRPTSEVTRQEAAKAFWDKVRALLQDNYVELLGALNDFQARRIEPATMKQRVKLLLSDHWELVLELNAFLPACHQIKEEEIREETAILQPQDSCGSCGRCNKDESCWVVCGSCGKTFHCNCVLVSPAVARRMPSYTCQQCSYAI